MITSSDGNRVLNDMRRSLEREVREVISEINTLSRETTPIRTGYARSGWTQTRLYNFGYTGPLIENRVPYIGLLDQGTSRQAPNGIVEPVLNRVLSRSKRL